MKKIKKFKTIEEAEAKLKVGEEYILENYDIPEILLDVLDISNKIKKTKVTK